MTKRAFDIVLSAIGLVLLAPVFLIIAVCIRLDSRGPVIFRQWRVGKAGEPFRIHKFRTMRTDSECQGQLTIGSDSRVTRPGRILRELKLDEIPQLIDVLLGNMSLVGPRPEVPKYISYYSEADQRTILSVRPGITDLASVRFRKENEILGRPTDPETEYVQHVLPAKLAYYRAYVEKRTILLDIYIILRTLRAVASR